MRTEKIAAMQAARADLQKDLAPLRKRAEEIRVALLRGKDIEAAERKKAQDERASIKSKIGEVMDRLRNLDRLIVGFVRGEPNAYKIVAEMGIFKGDK